MTFTEDNEIVCETRLNVIHTYIHTYVYTKIGFKVGLLLTEAKKPKSHYNFSFIFIFLPLDCNLKHTYIWIFISCDIILYWDIYWLLYYHLNSLFKQKLRLHQKRESMLCSLCDRKYLKMCEWVSSTGWFF